MKTGIENRRKNNKDTRIMEEDKEMLREEEEEEEEESMCVISKIACTKREKREVRVAEVQAAAPLERGAMKDLV